MIHHGDNRRIADEIDTILNGAATVDDELKASLARYVCILASSYLETSIRSFVAEYAERRSHPSVAAFVQSTLRYFRDPNVEKILQLVGRLGTNYRDALEQQLSDKDKDSVNSICANRNNVAHGRQSGISLGQISNYYSDARRVVDKANAVLS
jgi:hypothetical protein